MKQIKMSGSYGLQHGVEFFCLFCFVLFFSWAGNYWRVTAHWPSGRVFANGPGDLRSIPGRVIPKTQKMVLDTSLLNTQHYKVRFEGKVERSRKRSSALPYTSV